MPRVCRFDQPIRQSVRQLGGDGLAMLLLRPVELDERWDATSLGPRAPRIERVDGLGTAQLGDQP